MRYNYPTKRRTAPLYYVDFKNPKEVACITYLFLKSEYRNAEITMMSGLKNGKVFTKRDAEHISFSEFYASHRQDIGEYEGMVSLDEINIDRISISYHPTEQVPLYLLTYNSRSEEELSNFSKELKEQFYMTIK